MSVNFCACHSWCNLLYKRLVKLSHTVSVVSPCLLRSWPPEQTVQFLLNQILFFVFWAFHMLKDGWYDQNLLSIILCINYCTSIYFYYFVILFINILPIWLHCGMQCPISWSSQIQIDRYNFNFSSLSIFFFSPGNKSDYGSRVGLDGCL